MEPASAHLCRDADGLVHAGMHLSDIPGPARNLLIMSRFRLLFSVLVIALIITVMIIAILLHIICTVCCSVPADRGLQSASEHVVLTLAPMLRCSQHASHNVVHI